VECELKSFCVLPWIHSFVNSNGAYQICCISEEHHHGILDKKGEYFNIQNRPELNDVMNSEMMKELRLNMLKGEWSPPCRRCLETETNGGSSRRNIENAAYEEKIPELIAQTKPDGEIKVRFKSIDYRLGNKCNLQCRMCNPLSTSNWIKEWNELKTENEHLTVEMQNHFSSFTWPDDELLFDELREKLDGVERIHFAGGEPLMSNQMANILRECIRLDQAKNISVSYNTNATVLPKDVLELWKEFKEIKLLCSVDGYGAVNDFIRYPSKWSVIDRNLHFLDDHAEELKISEIILSCTVQVYNALYLKDLFDYLKNFKKIDPVVNLINLHFPEYMSTQVLPPSAKKVATERIQAIISDLNVRGITHNFHLSNLPQAIAYMNKKDRTVNLISFKKFNSAFDKKKNTKISAVLPELNSHLVKFYFENLFGKENDTL
jgi:MoaA/NifB/PqqE/SkfB family radical SAM enzyme